MINELPECHEILPYRFYFDKLFTCQIVVVHLKECGYAGIGTICENCLLKICQLPTHQVMSKELRSTFQYVSSKESLIIIAAWLDNSAL